VNPFNRNAALWIVIVLLLALLYSVFQGGTTRTAGNTISYSDFVRAVDQRQVQDVRISATPSPAPSASRATACRSSRPTRRARRPTSS
jgi:ATP-dependent Zn protease